LYLNRAFHHMLCTAFSLCNEQASSQ